MMAPMRALWILIGVALAGCATYQPRPLDPVQMAGRFSARSLNDAGLRAYLQEQLGHPVSAWPLHRWNRSMLTLAAGYYSPVLAAGRAQHEGAQAIAASAGVRPNPTLQFPFEYTLNNDSRGRPFTTGPTFDWPIETGGKPQARSAQAAAQAEVVRQNLLHQAWQIHSQVRGALLAVFVAERRIAVLAEQEVLQRAAVELWQHRVTAGVAAATDVRRVRMLLTQAQSDQAAAKAALRDTRERLATAIGIPLSALDGVAFDFTEFDGVPVPPPSADAHRAAMTHRADLHAALAEYETSQATLALEVARQYPDVHLGVGYTYDTGANKINFGLAGLTLPLFDTNRGPIQQAEARRREQAARVEALQAAMSNELDRALERMRESAALAERAAQQRALSERQRGSAQAGFNAGATDRAELIQVQADCQTAKLAQIDSLAGVQTAAGLLEDAMQQPLDINPLSSSMTSP